jgi:mitochondrial fission protein ELM1
MNKQQLNILIKETEKELFQTFEDEITKIFKSSIKEYYTENLKALKVEFSDRKEGFIKYLLNQISNIDVYAEILINRGKNPTITFYPEGDYCVIVKVEGYDERGFLFDKDIKNKIKPQELTHSKVGKWINILLEEVK